MSNSGRFLKSRVTSRYESFGSITAFDFPPFLLYLGRFFTRLLIGRPTNGFPAGQPYLSAPTEVHLCTTNRCNLHCAGCYTNADAAPDTELPTADWKKYIDILASKKVFHVALGGGEALLRDDIFELAGYARQKGIIPNLTTNGTMVFHENAEKFKVFGQLNLSLDQLSPGKLFSQKKLTAALRGIRILKKHQLTPGINCVVSRENFAKLETVFQFTKQNKLKEIELLRLKPAGRAKAIYHNLKCTARQYRGFYPLIKKLARRYKVMVKVDCSFLPMLCAHNPSLYWLKKLGAYGCEAGNVLCAVDHYGQLMPCSFSKASPYKAPEFNKFWTGGLVKNFRDWLKTAPPPCADCRYLELCRGGCHPVAAFLSGDFNQPDPDCPRVNEYQNK
ncbi:MAG TPA: radical SAM protein [Spirochaetota bacterium]|nr:radical SAM protein [Spirochaetota bacterium]